MVCGTHSEMSYKYMFSSKELLLTIVFATISVLVKENETQLLSRNCHIGCDFYFDKVCAYDRDSRSYRAFINPCFMDLVNKCDGAKYVPVGSLWFCRNSPTFSPDLVTKMKTMLRGRAGPPR
uniref:Kazal-like domain-containing protein n=1 Tax=Homalodisca liturata TaxID=320908 RepID=A0A1B6HZV3_9HEMI